MENKKLEENEQKKSEEVPELKEDRDDALGYSREQFDFEIKKTKPKAKKPEKKKKT